jgi:hypothetical protein
MLCVASSGITLLLLPGGHTAHSTFSIPVEDLNQDSCCQIDKHSKQAEMMHQVRLIIWDEAVTQHKYYDSLLLYQIHSNRSILDTQLRLLTACFKTSAQQAVHLVASPSCSEETSSKRCPSSLKVVEKTSSRLRFNAPYCGATLKSFTSVKTCESTQMLRIYILHNGCFPLVMDNPTSRAAHPHRLPSSTRCDVNQKMS